MKVAIPVGGYHPGNPSDYVKRAFEELGHSATIIDSARFFEAFRAKEFDFYFCVDSGEAINLLQLGESSDLSQVAFWFIDFRHNKDRATRIPNDLTNAIFLSSRKGWVFQAQEEDSLECSGLGIKNVAWLPLAADPNIWSYSPSTPKQFDVGFVGNVWDQVRLDALQSIQRSGLRLGMPQPGSAWLGNAARIISSSRVGFNISSFFGSKVAFDLNMRFFETLSCGVPLITNFVPSCAKLIPDGAPFILYYQSLSQIIPLINNGLASDEFLSSGAAARDWVMKNATYKARISQALQFFARSLPAQ